MRIPHFAFGIVATASLASSEAVSAAEPFQAGYISTNVDCAEAGKPKRIRFVSQIFGYCPLEISRAGIIEENRFNFRQVVKATCGENYSISFEYVNFDPDETKLEEERQKSLNEQGYNKVVEWFASVLHYSTKCR